MWMITTSGDEWNLMKCVITAKWNEQLADLTRQQVFFSNSFGYQSMIIN